MMVFYEKIVARHLS